MTEWHKLHITDKTGKEFFNVTASPMSTPSEIKNLQQHIKAAQKNPGAYKFLDVGTMVVMLDGSVYGDKVDVDYDALLAELGI